MKTRFIVSSALLSLSISTFAGGMGCLPGNVVVPCQNDAWDFGISALYMRAKYDTHRVPTYNFGGFRHTYTQDWDWGIDVEGSYHFSTGNDFTVNWLHYENDTYNNIAITFPFPVNNNSITGSFSHGNKFNQVNAVFGQRIDLSNSRNMRLYAGLQYAKIQGYESLNARRVSAAPAPVAQQRTYDSFDLEAVGPVIGMNYDHAIGYGFSLVGQAQTSLVYGNQKQRTFINLTAGNAAVAAGAVLDKHSIVPSIDGKIALSYGMLSNWGLVHVDLGYQALNYFNALFGIPGNNNIPTDTDYGLQGVYLGGKWVGNW